MSYFFIGDIHGYFSKLVSLMEKIKPILSKEDIFVFLGDYIDRGPQSFDVIEYLLELQNRYKTVFIKGNHESMFLQYLADLDIYDNYLINGGRATIKSYAQNLGSFYLPEDHQKFFEELKLYYEGDDFIAVHAGLDPKIDSPAMQSEKTLTWIREQFYTSQHHWRKTVIFGHTPASHISAGELVFRDPQRNIIGIDSGVYSGGPLIALRWPEDEIYLGEV